MARRQMSSWAGESSDEDESEESRLLGGQARDYQATQKQYIQEHEEGLDKLGQAIKRQKQMANEIATEVDVHNEIIDTIDEGLTRTDANIRKSTRNIKLVSRKSSTFFLWLLIVILALVIALLAII